MTASIAPTKISLVSAVLAMLVGSFAVAQAQQTPEQLAQQSAESWLALVDSGRYADTWDEASQMFKAAITKEKWQDALHSVRGPLGQLVSRKLKSANYTKSLPGAPDGEYVVIQYQTRFEHKQTAVETITPLLEKDGKWRVSGYFIK